eukprot:6435509-Prymnesium_polylepis.2
MEHPEQSANEQVYELHHPAQKSPEEMVSQAGQPVHSSMLHVFSLHQPRHGRGGKGGGNGGGKGCEKGMQERGREQQGVRPSLAKALEQPDA